MKQEEIIALMKREIVPAIGCTEPMCVALCVAYATETLGCEPTGITVRLSANILKNAMGVGIPGTGMVGLPIAIALGALIGKSEYQLQVLQDCTPEAVERGKELISKGVIRIELEQKACDNLYVDVVCCSGEHKAQTIIAHEHDRLVFLSHDGNVITDERDCLQSGKGINMENRLNLREVYDFAMDTPLELLEFINEARVLNEKAADEALKGNYGHELGKTLSRPLGKGIMGDSIFSHILSTTSCACDARMAGAMIPVMSNSGSGNQGIAATLPVVVFARENHNTEEELTRALILSHLTAIYIKQSLGRLSALCGCVVASTGSSCGITYLMGGNYDQVVYSVKNMIANLAGMVCDGAKPSCALKVSSGVSTAVLSAMLAIQNKYVTNVEGLIEHNVDRCIHNLTRVGAKGMEETDRTVLDIMTHKVPACEA
ncbi:MAG: serine dehydratase subunit alpha family protein [Bacteroidaceae bacterium]|nr:serine dehydratase subunit alpha family protein [Bacteroidaceae bacterium]